MPRARPAARIPPALPHSAEQSARCWCQDDPHVQKVTAPPVPRQRGHGTSAWTSRCCKYRHFSQRTQCYEAESRRVRSALGFHGKGSASARRQARTLLLPSCAPLKPTSRKANLRWQRTRIATQRLGMFWTQEIFKRRRMIIVSLKKGKTDPKDPCWHLGFHLVADGS